MKSLDSVIIHQFRGIRDLELKDLGRVNLLVGINNSGKTSVLEALQIYSNPLDIKTWLITACQRELQNRVPRNLLIDALRWLFSQNPVSTIESPELIILISSTGLFSVKKLIASYEVIEEIWLKKSENDQIQENEEEDDLIQENEDIPGVRKGMNLKIELFTEDGQLSLFDTTPTITKNFPLWQNKGLYLHLYKPSGTREPSLNTATVTSSSHRSADQIRLLSQARFRNFKSDVVRLLQQIDSNISDIEILSPPQSISSVSTSSVYIYIQHKKLGLVPLSSFGDGIRRLLHIALKLSSVKEGGILLIDELDSTIHTEALQNYFQWLVKWCAEMDVQLFATTHSLEAVDALLQVTESDSDLVLYRLEPKEEKTRVVRHDGYRLRRLRQELGQEVRW